MKTLLTASVVTIAMYSSTALAGQEKWKDAASDAWIDGKVEATLMFNSNVNSFSIDTDVEDGTVKLTGTVENETDKALAGELAASVKGVQDVDNDLRVKSDKDNKNEKNYFTDRKITTVVKTRLLMESEVKGSNIDVDTDGQVVKLEGTVSSRAERDLALQIAENTSDVKRVVDKLRIK